MSTTYYVAGPMRGLPNFNFPAFVSCATYLRRFQDTKQVFNPAEHDLEVDPYMEQRPGFFEGDIKRLPGFDFHEAMRWDLARVTESDAIVLLPGWEISSGAAHEKYVAEACGAEVLYAYPVSTVTGEWFISPEYFPEWRQTGAVI